MNAAGELGTSASSSSSATWSTTADSALTDYSRTLGGDLAVVPSHGRRDAPGLDGHRPTETSLAEAAA